LGRLPGNSRLWGLWGFLSIFCRGSPKIPKAALTNKSAIAAADRLPGEVVQQSSLGLSALLTTKGCAALTILYFVEPFALADWPETPMVFVSSSAARPFDGRESQINEIAALLLEKTKPGSLIGLCRLWRYTLVGHCALSRARFR